MPEVKKYTASEIAIKMDIRINFLNHLIERNAVEVVREGDYYYATDADIALINERNRHGRAELRRVFENREEIRRRVVRQMVVESSGVEPETAKRLGY